VAILKGVGKKISQNSGGFLKGVAGAAAGLGGSRKAMGALAIGAFGAGMMSKAGPAAMDATMEGAFGDANADRYFTGRDLSLRTFAGAGIGGIGGEALQITDPGDYAATNPVMSANPLASSRNIGGLTGIAGGIIGGLTKGRKGALIGGLSGMAVGGAVGGLGSVASPLVHMRNNQQFFSQSPYSPMGRNSGILNASGDIVLGMHNSRRSY